MKKIRKKKLGFVDVFSITLTSVVFFLCVLFVVAYFVGGNILYKIAVASKMRKDAQRMSDTIAERYESPDNYVGWVQTATKLSVQKVTNKDLDLYAVQYLAETESDVWVITLHGYRSRWAEMAGYAYEFHEKGYNVIIPEMRGQGLSQYQHLGLGYFDKYDVITWIDYIVCQNPNAKIVLHGRSMGGAAVMMTTGEELPSNVVCAIEDCGYSNAYDEFYHVIKNVVKFPFAEFLIEACNGATKRNTGVALRDIDCVAALKNSKTPTLFIHGSTDSFVPFWMLDVVYNANPTLEKQKLVVDGAEHAMSSTKAHDLYFDTVFSFIESHM